MSRKSGTGFPSRQTRNAFARRSCSNKKIERDDDSKKSHHALELPFRFNRNGKGSGVVALRREPAAPPRPDCAAYGLRRQRPTVGDEPHFAPSGAPPLGQNTETNISLASQSTGPSA